MVCTGHRLQCETLHFIKLKFPICTSGMFKLLKSTTLLALFPAHENFVSCRSQSSCEITLEPPKPGVNERVITIMGSANSIQYAQQLMQNRCVGIVVLVAYLISLHPSLSSSLLPSPSLSFPSLPLSLLPFLSLLPSLPPPSLLPSLSLPFSSLPPSSLRPSLPPSSLHPSLSVRQRHPNV